MKLLKIIEQLGNIPIRWATKILSAFENHPKTLMWLGILALVTISDNAGGLPFMAGIVESIRGLLKK